MACDGRHCWYGSPSFKWGIFYNAAGSPFMATETASYHAIEEANLRAEADALRTLILCAILFVVAAVGGGLAIILSLIL